jgi:hypothetical protein
MSFLRHAFFVFAAGALCWLGDGCVTRDVGLAERCADFMQRAFPRATIEVARREAAPATMTTIIAKVEGIRSDVPPEGPAPRELAVECRFDDNILTDFHWTSGPTR